MTDTDAAIPDTTADDVAAGPVDMGRHTDTAEVFVQARFYDDGRLVVVDDEIGTFAPLAERAKFEWNLQMEEELLIRGFRPASSWSRGLGELDDDGNVVGKPDRFFTMLVRPADATV